MLQSIEVLKYWHFQSRTSFCETRDIRLCINKLAPSVYVRNRVCLSAMMKNSYTKILNHADFDNVQDHWFYELGKHDSLVIFISCSRKTHRLDCNLQFLIDVLQLIIIQAWHLVVEIEIIAKLKVLNWNYLFENRWNLCFSLLQLFNRPIVYRKYLKSGKNSKAWKKIPTP